ncbi:hypothetical protein [Psychrobacter sp. I-STPA10]|uniref:hypothetical protein n=1 Tax=Psychrobacter sp. I-STPA10 TaxID=2585769 RepID=UPI001E568C67|nr:hypothetical protein [Psychrobacter sp. I-STPA10]
MATLHIENVPQQTVSQLSKLAQQSGMSIEEYHQSLLNYWVQSPKQLDKTDIQSLSQIQSQTPSQTDTLVDCLLSMPNVGLDSDFERVQDDINDRANEVFD